MENHGNQSKLMEWIAPFVWEMQTALKGFQLLICYRRIRIMMTIWFLRTRHYAQKETNALWKASDERHIVMSSTLYSYYLIANPPKGSGYELSCYRVACGHVLIKNILRALTEASKYSNAYSPSASVCTGKSSGMHCPLAWWQCWR